MQTKECATLGVRNLLGCVLNNRHPQPIMIAQVPHLPSAPGDALDLLNSIDLETSIRTMFYFDKQSDQNSPLGMGMDAAPSSDVEC